MFRVQSSMHAHARIIANSRAPNMCDLIIWKWLLQKCIIDIRCAKIHENTSVPYSAPTVFNKPSGVNDVIRICLWYT